MGYESFKDTIQKAGSIIIFSHVNPDGDTLGTMSALHQAIKTNFNKDSIMVVSGIIPEIYHFLPSINEMVSSKDLDKNIVYDLAIAVDIAAKDRMVDGLSVYEKAKVKMNIDHHKTNNDYGDVNFVKGDASSAGEVLFDILEDLNLKIDSETAKALYTAILTDTGGFRFENTKATTLKKASKMIEYGANPAEISRYCYESKPKPMVLLQANCLLNAKFIEDNKVAYVCITNKDLEKFNAQNDHTEGIVEALRRINTTEISFVLKEVDENTTKASLRSKTVDVSEIASAFNGGGHTFAAGCTIHKPLNIACDKMIEEIKKHL